MARSLSAGQVYKINPSEIVRIHPTSNEYEQDCSVIPDGENFIKVRCNDIYYAIAKNEEHRCINVKDKEGNSELHLKGYSNYIQCTDASGRTVYFTDEEAANVHNFKFSIRIGRYMHAEHPEFYGNEYIGNYHDSKLKAAEKFAPKFVNENDEYLFGVEVEKVDLNLRNEGNVYELFEKTGWKKENDGSLGSEGYELISPILPLYDNERIEKAIAPVKEFINGKSNDRCGGHFNLSKKNTNSTDLLEGIKGFVPLLYALYPNRVSNHYCQAKQWRRYFGSADKYSAFYRKSDKILEIRLFGRVTKLSTLNWRIKLMQLLVSDYGNNLNQYVLKLSNFSSPLYQLMKEQYTHNEIALKIRECDTMGKQYACGTISKSIKIKVNERFSLPVFPEVWNGDRNATL